MIFSPFSFTSARFAFIPQSNTQTGFNISQGALGPVLQNVDQTANNVAVVSQLG